MAIVQKTGVYWPFKTLLEGSGITLADDGTNVTISTTGAGPGGGDMLKSQYATKGISGVVDHAVLADSATTVSHASAADSVPWAGITGAPTVYPTDWSTVQNKPAVFPTTWAQVSGAPAVFPPAQHGSTHISDGGDPIPLADLTDSGLFPPLSGNATDVFLGTGAFSPVAPLVAATALLRAGDALTVGAILVGTKDATTTSTSPSTSAAFRAQSQTHGGFGAIGLLCQNFWGCALGAYQTGLFIATSAGNFQQLTDQSGKIVGAALAADAAVTNLGYTPISGSGGGTYTPTGPIILYKDVGLAANSYAYSPLRLQAATAAGRPQISFLMPNLGAALYLETDSTFRYINSGGAAARLFDSLHPIAAADMAAGAAVGNIGYTPVNKAGDSMPNARFTFSQDMPANSGSYAAAVLQITTLSTNPATVAGIALTNEGRVGIYLYLGNDGNLYYVSNGGVTRQIAHL